MCLEVFLGTNYELSETDDRLRIDGRVPGDIKKRLEGLNVIHIGAAHTGCGCGFLVEGENAEENEIEDKTRLAHRALLSYIDRVASQEPVRLIVRWAGDSLKRTNTTDLALGDLDTLDLSIAWDHPQDIVLRPS